MVCSDVHVNNKGYGHHINGNLGYRTALPPPVFGVCRSKNDSPSIAMCTWLAVREQRSVDIIAKVGISWISEESISEYEIRIKIDRGSNDRV